MAHVFREGLAPRVVVIEDAEVEREGLASYLTELGYRVDTAADGMAGFKLLTPELPHLVILDLDMPKMGGVQVLRRLRANTETKSVYVIVTSGLTGGPERQRAFEAGCNQYIVKPFSLASLGRALHAYFWKLGVVDDVPLEKYRSEE